MNFDFKASEQETMLEKKSVVPKLSKFKIFRQGFNMNLSLSRLPSSFWSIFGLILSVVALHYKVENAAWAIPVSCLLYYSSKQVVPFLVMLIALAGMATGIPELAFLMIFSVVTMINWSNVH